LYEPSGELQRRRKEDEKGKRGRLINKMTRLKNEQENSMNKGGSQRRENLNVEKSEAKKNIPQSMLQTVNG